MTASVTHFIRRIASYLGLGPSGQLRRKLNLIVGSQLFNRSWYLENYGDVRDSGVDPARHYLESGWREGRDPGPEFSTTAYLKANADVAALGVNPLLHYIEFGQAEGRGAPGPRTAPRILVDPVKAFGLAAPCAIFAARPSKPVNWRRAGRIRTNAKNIISIGDVVIGYAKDGGAHDRARKALWHLAWWSGHGEIDAEATAGYGSGPRIADAWFAGMGILRLRWITEGRSPVVVRGLQQLGEEPVLVGEGLIGNEFDVFDARLGNPLFPLLFLFTEPDGQLLGAHLLHFPSLCRGGLHYPEFVALSKAGRGSASLDVQSIDQQLGKKLHRLRKGLATPVVTEILVDVANSDGTDALFRTGVQSWLGRVMCVRVHARGASRANPASRYLSEVVEVASGPVRNEGVGDLVLASSMIATISALVAAGEGEIADQAYAGSLIVACKNQAFPITLVHAPTASDGILLTEPVPVLPLLIPSRPGCRLPRDPGLLALKIIARPPAFEAELLYPGGLWDGDHVGRDVEVNWLIRVSDWDEQQLQWSLEALAHQHGLQRILFIGGPSQTIMTLAGRLFADRIGVVGTMEDATEQIDGGIAGHIGAGIILHDLDTVAKLAPALDRPQVQIVTAPVLTVDRRGKGWAINPPGDDTGVALQMMPGATLPVANFPSEFWIARTEFLKQQCLSGAAPVAGASLVLSTRASVCRIAANPVAAPPIAPLWSRAADAVVIETVAG